MKNFNDFDEFENSDEERRTFQEGETINFTIPKLITKLNNGRSRCDDPTSQAQTETKSTLKKPQSMDLRNRTQVKKVEVFISEYPTIETVIPVKEEERVEVKKTRDELIAKRKQS
jgi:hypothetical protein